MPTQTPPVLVGIIGMLTLLFLAAMGIALYFLPTMIAHSRKKANFISIFALNFLAGWTFIGWVIALVWALTVEPKANQEAR